MCVWGVKGCRVSQRLSAKVSVFSATGIPVKQRSDDTMTPSKSVTQGLNRTAGVRKSFRKAPEVCGGGGNFIQNWCIENYPEPTNVLNFSLSIQWMTSIRWRSELLWTTPSSTSRFPKCLCVSATKWVSVHILFTFKSEVCSHSTLCTFARKHDL